MCWRVARRQWLEVEWAENCAGFAIVLRTLRLDESYKSAWRSGISKIRLNRQPRVSPFRLSRRRDWWAKARHRGFCIALTSLISSESPLTSSLQAGQRKTVGERWLREVPIYCISFDRRTLNKAAISYYHNTTIITSFCTESVVRQSMSAVMLI
jgi:hypothetical protein